MKDKPLSPSSSSTFDGSPKQGNAPQIIDTWYDDGGPIEGVNYGCKGDPTVCHEEIIVVIGGGTPALTLVLDALADGDEVKIKTAFSKDQDELAQYFSLADIQGIASGGLRAQLRISGARKYVIVRDASDHIIAVYRFKN